MPKLVKDLNVVEDNWILIKPEGEDSAVNAQAQNIVPLQVWQEQKDNFTNDELAVWLDSHEEVKAISDHLDALPLVAINFPLFTDGRGYSLAAQLREHYNYQGEIRAIGDVLLDQLFYMQRAGFNSFSLREEAHYETALDYFDTFSEVYQSATKEQTSILEKRLNA